MGVEANPKTFLNTNLNKPEILISDAFSFYKSMEKETYWYMVSSKWLDYLWQQKKRNV